jgi:ribosomal protein S18 acetylase RimI-like enzyme
MHRPTIKTATSADSDLVLATLALAFSADPAVRWMYPDPFQFTRSFPGFARAFGGGAFTHGTACYVEGGCGASLWLPPGVQPHEADLVACLKESVTESRLPDVFGMFEQMDSFHPTEPHWYLPLIGVDPTAQGRGLGSLLLQHALAVSDRNQVPAYLEASNSRNVPLYERHGFRRLGEIQAGSSPTIYPMRRDPM